MSFEGIDYKGYVRYVWPVIFGTIVEKVESSREFKIDNLENVTFHLGLQIIKSGHASLWVQKSNPAVASAIIRVTVGDVKKEVDVNDWEDRCFILENYVIPESALIRQLYNSYGKVYNKLYELTITCEIFWKDLKKPRRSLEDNLYDDIRKFYSSEELSDVTIIVDNVKIPVHKFILAARSPVFSTMLQSDMKEARENVITIKDLEPEIVLEMLKYFYKGETKASDDTKVALQMLKVADMYQIMKLKEICVSTLLKKMSVYNVLSIVKEADDHDAVALRKKAIEFIVKHKKQVFASDEFKELFYSKEDLLDELFGAICKE